MDDTWTSCRPPPRFRCTACIGGTQIDRVMCVGGSQLCYLVVWSCIFPIPVCWSAKSCVWKKAKRKIDCRRGSGSIPLTRSSSHTTSPTRWLSQTSVREQSRRWTSTSASLGISQVKEAQRPSWWLGRDEVLVTRHGVIRESEDGRKGVVLLHLARPQVPDRRPHQSSHGSRVLEDHREGQGDL